MTDFLATIPVSVMIGAEGNAVTAYDWSNLDLSGVTNTANTIAGVVIPVVLAVALIPIGVKIFKRLLGKI